MSDNKYCSKIIYLFLVVLFIYNSFGYLLLYFPARTIIKQFVQKSINEKKIAPEDLSVLVFNFDELKAKKYDFIWVKPEKEFRFNGKMYDIEAKKITSDSVFFYCYYDHKENLIEKIFAIHFNDHKKDKTQNSVQRVLLVGFYYEELKTIYSKIEQSISTNIPLKINEADFQNHISDIPTPPPRIIV